MVFIRIETHSKAMYRTLLATCGSPDYLELDTTFLNSFSTEPHVASNVRYIAFSLDF